MGIRKENALISVLLVCVCVSQYTNWDRKLQEKTKVRWNTCPKQQQEKYCSSRCDSEPELRYSGCQRT